MVKFLKSLLAATKGGLTYTSAAALGLGLLNEVLGMVATAPELDLLATAVATVGVIYGRWRATRA